MPIGRPSAPAHAHATRSRGGRACSRPSAAIHCFRAVNRTTSYLLLATAAAAALLTHRLGSLMSLRVRARRLDDLFVPDQHDFRPAQAVRHVKRASLSDRRGDRVARFYYRTSIINRAARQPARASAPGGASEDNARRPPAGALNCHLMNFGYSRHRHRQLDRLTAVANRSQAERWASC